MKIKIQGHGFVEDVKNIISIFFPNEKFFVLDEYSIPEDDYFICSILENNKILTTIYNNGQLLENETLTCTSNEPKYIKFCVKSSLLKLLKDITNTPVPWGILTGIRPAKIIRTRLENSESLEEIKKDFLNNYLVQEDKFNLTLSVAQKELEIMKCLDENSISIYIGIPFCPTKCSYCSFTSYSIKKYSENGQVDLYLDALEKELNFSSEICKNKKIESIYIGGGTPTSLNSAQLDRLLKIVSNNFDTKNALEYTVEAGRPDTITEEKLSVMKKYGVTRISINPQTFSDKTLKLIGRDHTVEDFLNKFKLARNMGFNNINIDLILGLPEETPEDVENTMENIIKLEPENVTIHTLAIKRAAQMKLELDTLKLNKYQDMEAMLDISFKKCIQNNLLPYYLYRQKNMIGNFENIGYSKVDFESLYNIQIMEEKQSILAFGAGGSSKIVFDENRYEKIYNVKSVDDYISRIDEMLVRKKILTDEWGW